MINNYTYSNSIRDSHNKLLASVIKERSNLELIKSEEAIKAVIRSYTDRFRAIEGKITDIQKYLVKPYELVNLEYFNDLFSSIYIDIYTLYKEIEYVEYTLELNLHRNKNFYLAVKKRTRDLWQQLSLLRLTITNTTNEELIHESFLNSINIKNINGCTIDKKKGIIYLDPKRTVTFNNKFDIKKITTNVYPSENPTGGVLVSTSPLNTYSYNYGPDKPQDMLKNGLWKEEIVCTKEPKMIVDIGDSIRHIYRELSGIVAIVDIEFVKAIRFNRLDIDLFGDLYTTIDSVLYKNNELSSWTPYEYKPSDDMLSIFSMSSNILTGDFIDVAQFTNIESETAKFLRLVFNKKSGVLLANKSTSITAEEQIDKDLSERRYDIITYNHKDTDVGKPTQLSYSYDSIVSQLMGIVESTRDLDKMLSLLYNSLNPDIMIGSADFNKSIKYELGAWSIEPSLEIYSNAGSFESKNYSIADKHILSVSLKVNEQVPTHMTSNWYVSVKNNNVPIMSQNSSVRREPINFITIPFSPFSSFTGKFVLLDFPVDKSNIDLIQIYENGNISDVGTYDIAYFNSRLLYIHKIKNASRSEYVIRYNIAKDLVTQYILAEKNTTNETYLKLPYCITSSSRDLLNIFCRYAKMIESTGLKTVGDIFNVVQSVSTLSECESWYGVDFNNGIFIDQINAGVSFLLQATHADIIKDLVVYGTSKVGTTESDIINYSNGLTDTSDLTLNSVYSSIAPLNNRRTI